MAPRIGDIENQRGIQLTTPPQNKARQQPHMAISIARIPRHQAPVTTSYGDFYDTDTSSSSSASSSTYADFYDTGDISSFSEGDDFEDSDFGDSDFGSDDFGGGSDFGGDDYGGGDDW